MLVLNIIFEALREATETKGHVYIISVSVNYVAIVGTLFCVNICSSYPEIRTNRVLTNEVLMLSL